MISLKEVSFSALKLLLVHWLSDSAIIFVVCPKQVGLHFPAQFNVRHLTIKFATQTRERKSGECQPEIAIP